VSVVPPVTRTPYPPATGRGEGAGEAPGEVVGDGAGVAVAEARAELEAVAGGRADVLVDPQAARRRMATTQVRTLKRRTVFWTKPERRVASSLAALSPQCERTPARGVTVSGSILRLKQGSDPHPQGRGLKGLESADGFRLSVLFYLDRMEE
jgi:hypothetical protein